MLVTFQTKAHHDITMFGDPAKKLLKLMGLSGNVPSAIDAADVPAALEKLRARLARVEPDSGHAEEVEDDTEKEPVGLSLRAYPLLKLLEAAAVKNCAVMWH
jgi:Domain of unknown function (DUF1840)